MKKLLLLCFAVGLSVVVSAQKVYFLYLQTDDQTPFYVRMADKIYSSSTYGYLIIPNLRDSNYQIGLGFAKSTQPETRFAVAINQNDKGYLVKNFSEGLSLFDLQDLSIVKAISSNRDNTVYETKTDKFSAVLSKAADDPGLLKVPVAKKEEPKPPTIEKKEVVVAKKEEPKITTDTPKDSSIVPISETVQAPSDKKEAGSQTVTEPSTTVQTSPEPDKQPAVKEPVSTVELQVSEYKPSTIVRRSESSTTEGFGVVFLDKTESRTDTIRILIPPSKTRIDADAQTASLSEIEKRNVGSVTESAPVKPEKSSNVDSSSFLISREEVNTKTSVVSNTANCKENASEKDFMKLRKNMAAKENDEAMIEEAKKVFRNRCFSVEQLRYLSTLFLTSAAKYQFFDASYNYVSDRSNFNSLQAEIKDEYYLKRFKALVGE